MGTEEYNWKEMRSSMVQSQLIARDITDGRVLDAMNTVERHLFVPDHIRECSYDDNPLPIGYGQTISQPYIVALMTQLCELKGAERVLEIGTGSGYQTAVLAMLAGEVYTIEKVEELAKPAPARLRAMGFENIHFRAGNGYDGWEDAAPFDAIMLTASPPRIPSILFNQLAEGGIIVSPEGSDVQELVRIRKIGGAPEREHITWVRFVMMR